jgi:hypothetical protein
MEARIDEVSVLRWYGIDLPRLDDCAACGEKFLAAEGADFAAAHTNDATK